MSTIKTNNYYETLPVPVRLKGELQIVNTPAILVEKILDGFPIDVYKDLSLRWLVPFSKNGAFERRLGVRLMHGLTKVMPNVEDRKKYIVEEMIYSMCPTSGTEEIVKRHWLGTFRNEAKEYWKVEGNVEVRSFLSVKPHKDGVIMVKNTSGKEKAVKFDCVVGNPPYQESGGKRSDPRNLYPDFVLKALELDPQYVSMVIPARWLTGSGKGIMPFLEKMLGSKHLATITTTENSKDWFPDVDIKGGVMYFLYDRSKNDYVANVNGVPLNLENESVVISDPIGLAIRNKILAKSGRFFSDVMLGGKPFGINSNHSEWLKEDDSHNSYECFIKGKAVKHVSKSLIKRATEIIDKYKVCTARSSNKGKDGFSLSFVIGPNQIVSETYLVMSIHDQETEAQNSANYLTRPLVQYLVSMIKQTQDASRRTFQWVPYLDFSRTYTDQDLYAMFELTQEEIKHVEESTKNFPIYRALKRIKQANAA